MPVGAIALWSMLNGAIPAGWAECDGIQNAPGPDLRSRFVIGRSATHPVDATGGADTHTHPIGDHPALSHSGTAVADHASQVHTSSETPAHFETPTTKAGYPAHPALVHAVTQPSDHAAQVHLVSLANHEPPYYVLIYIQRMS